MKLKNLLLILANYTYPATYLMQMSELNPTSINDCIICYEPIGSSNTSITECNHAFHTTCLFKSALIKNACPCCRKPLTTEEQAEEQEIRRFLDRLEEEALFDQRVADRVTEIKAEYAARWIGFVIERGVNNERTYSGNCTIC